MNQSDKNRVIALCKLAQENGFFVRSVDRGYLLSGTDDSLLAFAEALMAEQREKDAKICESKKESIFEFNDEIVKETAINVIDNLAKAIRANKE